MLFERPGLAVRIASPRYQLAMKVMAARVERDEDDIVRLAQVSGMDSVEAVLELVQAAYPHVEIAPRVQPPWRLNGMAVPPGGDPRRTCLS